MCDLGISQAAPACYNKIFVVSILEKTFDRSMYSAGAVEILKVSIVSTHSAMVLKSPSAKTGVLMLMLFF